MVESLFIICVPIVMVPKVPALQNFMPVICKPFQKHPLFGQVLESNLRILSILSGSSLTALIIFNK